MTNPRTKDYDMYNEKSIEELAHICAESRDDAPIGRLTRFVYEQKTIEKQHKLNKDNIELQHRLNKQVSDKQNKILFICTIIQATTMLLAAIAGAYLAHTLSRYKDNPELKQPGKQTVQSQTRSSTSATLAEQKHDKVPSRTPQK